MITSPISPRLLSSFKKDEIIKIFKTAKVYYNNRGLLIKLAPKQLDFGRILVVTPKKSGNAPQRNLIRRRFKSIFLEDKLYELSYDWVIITSKEALSLSFETLRTIMQEVLEKNS